MPVKSQVVALALVGGADKPDGHPAFGLVDGDGRLVPGLIDAAYSKGRGKPGEIVLRFRVGPTDLPFRGAVQYVDGGVRG